jgi:hypothetical protein
MADSTPRRVLTVRLPPTVVEEVARRAQRCGLPVPQWVRIEAFLAEERCQHGPPHPATTAPADR